MEKHTWYVCIQAKIINPMHTCNYKHVQNYMTHYDSVDSFDDNEAALVFDEVHQWFIHVTLHLLWNNGTPIPFQNLPPTKQSTTYNKINICINLFRFNSCSLQYINILYMFWLMVKQFYCCPNSYKTYVSTRNCAFSKVPDSQNFEYIEAQLTNSHAITFYSSNKFYKSPSNAQYDFWIIQTFLGFYKITPNLWWMCG